MTLRPMSALAAIVLFSAAAHAGTAEVLIAAINRCAEIPDATARHNCYDQLPAIVNWLNAGSPTAPAPTSALPPLAGAPAAGTPPSVIAAAPQVAPNQPATVAAPPPSDSSSSMLWGAFDGEQIPADHIVATVESLTFDYGVFVVTLDNGQIWRQVAAVGEVNHFSREHKNRVVIWRDAFGKDVLKIEGFLTKYHVRRIK